MLAAMGLAAALCVGIGVFPGALYALLPYAVHYEPYTSSHVMAQLQLLFFSALAFAVLVRTGVYPPELRSVNLDSDWIYRVLFHRLWRRVGATYDSARAALEAVTARAATYLYERVYRHHGPEGRLARTWPTGSMALWVVVMLLTYLVLYYGSGSY
jgi:multicomponent Na+:H+ antiporter subunit D